MGRTYIVEDVVEGYLTKQCEQTAGPVSGLLIGQSSTQREYVVTATRTPQREESTASGGNSPDKEWVTEHARQVSRMLPGGLSVLGVFIVTDTDAKDTLTTLRQLVFAVENLISSERLWTSAEDDVSDRVVLHVNPKTRKTLCRTFDVKDPKSVAKPADWKYQSGVCSSWSTVSCCVSVDVLLPLPDNPTATEDTAKCLKEGLRGWAHQLESAVCLIDGRRLAADAELAGGQKRNVRQTYSAQLLITPDERRLAEGVQRCGGSVSVSGAVYSTAYLHSNKPKARQAEKLLKRDAVSTLTTRAQMLLEELLTSGGASEGSSRDEHQREQFCLPHRVFCPVEASGPVCVCDYRFSDEGLSEVIDRLKEMLDMDAAEKDLDIRRETPAEVLEGDAADGRTKPTVETAEALQSKRNYFGAAMATTVALLATAASMLYLNDV
ncbi:protein odr-4 homolog isoform X1 [Gasterosteus aculeatus]|uniref:protein odr-4 homolog isoform X1 n=1 Tax=Gasterosteus aculeatus aculeatus TaxID=481459 RepID=UPI001A982AEB|nr:protein odr-4 homolog isoform X1 [Gasterosteus aculeatus aculeatus]XP_040027745.1 protein odr-4 homolog isoform X1 [Gasterosteus aculeatus aculeatus]XP_040027746.1 protein odr-4 homolog isoform X1 [Gasterosteus aculeatus aculeatus]